MTLYSILSNILLAYSSTIQDYSTYRGFYHISFTKVGRKNRSTQFEIEQLRPNIDYIQLIDSSILVGFTSDYTNLKQAALELNLQHLVEFKRKELTIMQNLANFTRNYKTAIPFKEQFPELFI